ncbi:MAG: stage III sporulation protein AG [Lachnospiraceae bacterium]|nr:stage III sporulation protein AG [Lachnospiraceae bacterium]
MKLKKWLKRDNLIVLVLLGVLLFVISLPTKTDDRVNEERNSIQLTDNTVVETVALGKSKTDYVEELEERLQTILSDVEGVGKVTVMITLKASEELVLEKDESVNRSNTSEEDSEGGKRTVSQLESGESTVYISSGSNNEPYVIKTLLPTVEGVVVVAQGAGTGNVNRNITEIVMALFGVEAHKVQVVKMGVRR